MGKSWVENWKELKLSNKEQEKQILDRISRKDVCPNCLHSLKHVNPWMKYVTPYELVRFGIDGAIERARVRWQLGVYDSDQYP